MQPFSAIAIFCEDIREEASSQNTIIGTLPDNVALDGAAKPILSKLGVYLRLNFDAQSEQPRELSVKLINTNGEPLPLQGWSKETIEKAFSDSRANGMPLVGLILKVVAAPFSIPGAGKLTVVVNLNGSDYIAGAINITIPDGAGVRRRGSE